MNDCRLANPVRISIADRLGRDIDGAWWPRFDRMTVELPALVAALTPMLGDVRSIDVNWPHLQRPPELNRPGWEHRPQHVISVHGENARANLLIVAYNTYSGLALMVLRRAAGLAIVSTDRETPAFLTAGAILKAALTQCAATAQVPQNVR